MKKWPSVRLATFVFALLALGAPPFAFGQTPGASRLLNEDPNNWPMYHRSYDAFRFSPLGQINKDNVKNLSVAWVHQPGAIVQGLEATPLVVDGVMYYIASYNRVFALDADTGQLKWHFQEIPHDDWDYDSGLGESLVLDRDGKKLLVHQNKSGFVFVYDRTNGKLQNVWPMTHTYNFVKTIDPKTGELIGRKPPRLGKPEFICPWIAGGRSWNSGSYNPKTKLWYNTAMEVCEEVTVEKQTPQTEPAAGLFFGGDQVAKHPPGGEAYGHLDARDPVTGERKWSINFKYPPIGSVLSTGGGLVFHGDVEGVVHAYDADTGEQLWHFRTGSGHRGGPISYSVNGKQYIAIPSGLGSLVLGLYPALWPEVEDFPAGSAMFVFTLK